MRKKSALLRIALSSSFLAAILPLQISCSGTESGGDGFYLVGGTVSGLDGTVILETGDQTVSVSSDGEFHFPNAIANDASYEVTVTSQPAGQTCTVTNGSGTVEGEAVTNVEVTCADS